MLQFLQTPESLEDCKEGRGSYCWSSIVGAVGFMTTVVLIKIPFWDEVLYGCGVQLLLFAGKNGSLSDANTKRCVARGPGTAEGNSFASEGGVREESSQGKAQSE